MLIVATAAIAVAIAATAGAGSSADATLFLAPTGNDGNPCTKAAPCATFARAYVAARPGQEVELAAGEYADIQEIPVDPTKTSPNDVIFRPAAGATVVLPIGIDVYGSHVELRNLTIRGSFYVKCGADDVTLRGSRSGQFFIRPASNVLLVQSEFGPAINASSKIGDSGDCPGVSPRNIVLDRILIHDHKTDPPNSSHIECLAVDAVDGLTIRRSRFHRCEDYDILFKRTGHHPIELRNITLENNWFDAPYPDGTTSVALSFPDGGATYENVLIRNNSFGGTLLLFPDEVRYVNSRVIANVGPNYGGACGAEGLVSAYNVWGNRTCSRTDVRALPGYRSAVAFDFHLKPGSAAIDRGSMTSYPAVDIDGQKRPQGRRADAGADEAPAPPKPKPKKTKRRTR
jgi:hypothetical protein